MDGYVVPSLVDRFYVSLAALPRDVDDAEWLESKRAANTAIDRPLVTPMLEYTAVYDVEMRAWADEEADEVPYIIIRWDGWCGVAGQHFEVFAGERPRWFEITVAGLG